MAKDKKPVDKKPNQVKKQAVVKPAYGAVPDKQAAKDAQQLVDSLNSSKRAEAGDDALLQIKKKKGGKVTKMKCGGKVKGKKK